MSEAIELRYGDVVRVEGRRFVIVGVNPGDDRTGPTLIAEALVEHFEVCFEVVPPTPR